MRKEPGAHKVKTIFKGLLYFLLILFVFLSILPYLIPTAQLTGKPLDLAYPESTFTQINSIVLHYREWNGEPEKEHNILLLHGLGGSTFTWRYTAPYLQDNDYRVIAVDLPGFGLSERKSGFDHSAGNRAQVIWALLDQLGPDQKWHLVGHSMGGATVAAMALQKPERTVSVTLAAGALAYFEPSLLSLVYRYPPVNQWVKVLGSYFLLNEERIEGLLASAYGRQPTIEEFTGYYLPLTLYNTDQVMADLFLSAPSPLLDEVGIIDRPVLCLWGEDDTWVPLDRGKELQKLLQNSELVIIPGEGHCPMETAPRLFNDGLLSFLRKVEETSF